MEIIKFTNLIENDTYILETSTSLSKYKFLTVNDSLHISLPIKEICLSEKPILVKGYYVENVFHGWKNLETLVIISDDDYNKTKNVFLEFVTTDSSNTTGILKFPSLQDEVAYNRFIRNYEKHYLPEEKNNELIVIIDKTISTGNRYIKSMRLIGKDISNPTCHYIPNPYELVKDIGEAMGFKNLKESGLYKNDGLNWSVPDHSRNTLEYMKICGSYISKKFHFVSISGTLIECEDRYTQHANLIKEVFQIQLDIINETPLPNKGLVSLSLERIKNKIFNLDIKVSGANDKRYLLKEIQDLIDTLK